MAFGAIAVGAITAGISLYSSSVSARSAKKEQERKNKAIKMQQAWIQEEKKHARKVYEVQTFSKFYDEQAAGTMRIVAGSGLGGSSSTTAVMNQLSNSLLLRDVAVDDLRFRQQIRSLDNEITLAGLGIVDPDKVKRGVQTAGFAKAAGEGFASYLEADFATS